MQKNTTINLRMHQRTAISIQPTLQTKVMMDHTSFLAFNLKVTSSTYYILKAWQEIT